jgi:hypothetical protein
MTRLHQGWLIYAALLAALLVLAGVGITAARGLWFAHPASHDSNIVFDADYVQGLVKQGIVKLPRAGCSHRRSNNSARPTFCE